MSEHTQAEIERDAARWREYARLRKAATLEGALHVRMTMNQGGEAWCADYVLSTVDLIQGLLGVRQVGLSAERKYEQLVAAMTEVKF